MKVTKANETVVIESSRFRDTYTQIDGIPYGKPAHWRRVSEHKLGGTLARSLSGNGDVPTAAAFQAAIKGLSTHKHSDQF